MALCKDVIYCESQIPIWYLHPRIWLTYPMAWAVHFSTWVAFSKNTEQDERSYYWGASLFSSRRRVQRGKYAQLFFPHVLVRYTTLFPMGEDCEEVERGWEYLYDRFSLMEVRICVALVTGDVPSFTRIM